MSAVLILMALVGCRNEAGSARRAPQPFAEQAASAQSVAAKAAPGQQAGTVLEFINASNYTYVRVDTGSDKIWLAAPAFRVKVGDRVVFPPGMPMQNFQSKSLGRTFDLVYFVGGIALEGSEPASRELPAGHPKITRDNAAAPAPAKIDLSAIARPKGGKTVAEIYKERAHLSGKKVLVRGKVVKVNSGVMGKNWIHLKDGTGEQGANDLIVTTQAETKVGDTILVRGTAAADKDYGYGYKYAVIVEDAQVTVEKGNGK